MEEFQVQYEPMTITVEIAWVSFRHASRESSGGVYLNGDSTVEELGYAVGWLSMGPDLWRGIRIV